MWNGRLVLLYVAAQCRAKSVDGFDIQEDMVKLAKQATSDLKIVHVAKSWRCRKYAIQ